MVFTASRQEELKQLKLKVAAALSGAVESATARKMGLVRQSKIFHGGHWTNREAAVLIFLDWQATQPQRPPVLVRDAPFRLSVWAAPVPRLADRWGR